MGGKLPAFWPFVGSRSTRRAEGKDVAWLGSSVGGGLQYLLDCAAMALLEVLE